MRQRAPILGPAPRPRGGGWRRRQPLSPGRGRGHCRTTGRLPVLGLCARPPGGFPAARGRGCDAVPPPDASATPLAVPAGSLPASGHALQARVREAPDRRGVSHLQTRGAAPSVPARRLPASPSPTSGRIRVFS